uniref:CBS domain-containing protein n=1 Tax=Oryza punctata TaxID=4537 RepID=A0A0E0LYB3_ORYPU
MDATLLRSLARLAVRSTHPPPPPPRLHRPTLPSSCACGPLRAYAAPAAPAPAAHNNGVYTVGDFMTKRPNLHVVTPATAVDEALDILVQHKISGFPVIDDTGNGLTGTNTSMFPEVDSTWKTFREIQRLLSKTNGKVIADVMTYSPLVVRESTNLDAATRLLLETKYRRLPVVDSTGKLVGMITRGTVVRAALKIKKRAEENA